MDQIPSSDTLFEHAACGLLLTDVDGTIRKANATFCQWLGCKSDDLVAQRRRIQDLFTVGGRFFHHTHWGPLLELQGSVAEVQMDLVCSGGAVVPTLINVLRRQHGESTFDEIAVFIATDRKKYERELLTTRQAAENSLVRMRSLQHELQQSRDVLSLAMRTAKMGMWSRDMKTSSVWCSPELERLLGMEEGSFSGGRDDFYRMVHEADREPLKAILDNAVASASDYATEFRICCSDTGEWRTMEVRGRATYKQDGEPLTIFGIVIDVTERRNYELKLLELNQQLSAADKRKDEFLATLAHELRNPLAPMSNLVQVLKLKAGGDQDLRWVEEVVERQLHQLTHLVDDLMEASRITRGRLELRRQAVEVTAIVSQAVDASRAAIEAGHHQLKLSLPTEALILNADATRLIQMISNLLANAAKYTPSGGTIELIVEKSSSEAVIRVRDSGIGIASDKLSHIFEMFSQLTPALERSQGGLGIGLALVRGLAELHGGSVSAHSDGEGKGSEFTLRLPLPDAPLAVAPKRELPQVSSTGGKRVLIVDDNEDSAESLAMALQMLGHSTRTANNGLSGLRLAEAFLPEVVLLDIGLPGINGYEVARRLRKTTWGRDLLLIAATGWAQDKDKEMAKDAGFDLHFTKPIDFYALDNLLKSLDKDNDLASL